MDLPLELVILAVVVILGGLALVYRRWGFCALFGHQVGVGRVERINREPGAPELEVRSSRCTRCGESFRGDLAA